MAEEISASPSVPRATWGNEATVGASVEWYTPASVFERLGLGFDLDPCAPRGGLPWIPAERSFSIEDDGLSQEWHGRVWMNPPYGRAITDWLRRFAEHGNGVALVPTRTDTAWFREIVGSLAALCFVAGRISFVDSTGRPPADSAGSPSMLLACGEDNAEALRASGLGIVFGVDARPFAGQEMLRLAA